jgi:hypothetical protein
LWKALDPRWPRSNLQCANITDVYGAPRGEEADATFATRYESVAQKPGITPRIEFLGTDGEAALATLG